MEEMYWDQFPEDGEDNRLFILPGHANLCMCRERTEPER